MQREQFQQLVSRAAAVCARGELVVFGSQCVHALTVSPPAEVLVSVECDLWLGEQGEVAARLTAELGKDSAFAKTMGVYVDVLPAELPMLPEGWEQRLVPCAVADVTARCLEVHDLVVSKLAAGRLKDYEFIAAMLMAKLARAEEVANRIQSFRELRTRAWLLARLQIAAAATDVQL
jgi:hypothetical protein